MNRQRDDELPWPPPDSMMAQLIEFGKRSRAFGRLFVESLGLPRVVERLSRWLERRR